MFPNRAEKPAGESGVDGLSQPRTNASRQCICQLFLRIGICNPFKFVGIDHEAEFQQHSRCGSRASQSQIVPEQSIRGAVELLHQIVMQKSGQAVRLGIVPKCANPRCLGGVSLVGWYEMANRLAARALGPKGEADGSGGLLRSFLNLQVQNLQRTIFVKPMFRSKAALNMITGDYPYGRQS